MFLWQKHWKHTQLSTLTESGVYASMSDYCPNSYPYVTSPPSFWTSNYPKHSRRVLLETFLFVPIKDSENSFFYKIGVSL